MAIILVSHLMGYLMVIIWKMFMSGHWYNHNDNVYGLFEGH